jgi:hypothetical protein
MARKTWLVITDRYALSSYPVGWRDGGFFSYPRRIHSGIDFMGSILNPSAEQVSDVARTAHRVQPIVLPSS